MESRIQDELKSSINDYKITIVNSILDNVHGLIGLTRVENEIEKLPVFKRLQNISQLGFIKRVFPGALHTRYLHSIGVLFIADKIAINLGFDDNQRQIVRLAGMLHDIGHYPFSHDIEAVYMESPRTSIDYHINGKIHLTDDYDKLIKFLNPEIEMVDKLVGNRRTKFHHEYIGSIVIRNNIEIRDLIKRYYVDANPRYENYPDKDFITRNIIEDIAAIIVGDYTHKSVYFADIFTAMVQIIHSELDADNLDYLLRDATFSGTTYGIMDMGILISKLKMKKITFDLEQNGMPNEHNIIGISPKGIGFVEQFLMNRYMAYSQVIHHKYAAALSAMLKNVLRWFINDRISGFRYTDVETMAEMRDNDETFLEFNDSCILSAIDSVDTAPTTCPNITRIIIKHLKRLRAVDLYSKKSESIFTGINVANMEKAAKEDDLFLEWESTRNNIIDVNEGLHENAEENQQLRIISFQYQSVYKELTKQLPLQDIKASIKKEDDPEGKHLQAALFIRLANGIPIISDSITKETKPEDINLIIDDQTSFLHDIYSLKYIKIRKYRVDETV